MSEEELYNNIVEILSKGDFLQINGKPINLKELNDYINSQQQEIERLTKQNKALNEMYELTKKEYIRLNNIIKEVREYIENNNIYQDNKLKDILEILDKGDEIVSTL